MAFGIGNPENSHNIKYLSQAASHNIRYPLYLRYLLHSVGASANLAELTWHVGNMVKFPNQSQQNIIADLMGHPVDRLLKHFCPPKLWRHRRRHPVL